MTTTNGHGEFLDNIQSMMRDGIIPKEVSPEIIFGALTISRKETRRHIQEIQEKNEKDLRDTNERIQVIHDDVYGKEGKTGFLATIENNSKAVRRQNTILTGILVTVVINVIMQLV